MPKDTFNVHALTLEALVPTVECANPFAECVAFRHKPLEYSSYGSAEHNAGKSLGVVRHKKLRCQGPHHFTLGMKNLNMPRAEAATQGGRPSRLSEFHGAVGRLRSLEPLVDDLDVERVPKHRRAHQPEYASALVGSGRVLIELAEGLEVPAGAVLSTVFHEEAV